MDTKTVQISVGYDTITFGEYDSHFEQAIQKEDDLYRIPKNDITVTHVKRSIRTKENTIPKELQEYVQKGSRFRNEAVELEAKQKASQSSKSTEASSETKQSRDKDNENNDDAEQSDPEQNENDNANEAEQRNNSNQYIVDCVKFFNQSWQEVKRSNTEFTNNTHLIEHQQSAQFDKLPDLQYEVDTFDTPATEASDLNPDLIKFSHDPSKDKVSTMLSNNRVDLFQAYTGVTPSWSRDVPGQIASPTDSKNAPWSETLGPQIHVSVEELSFALGELEPFFGTLALYDVKRKLKLSENFHFDINSKQTIELLGPHKGKRDDNPIRNALFSSSYSSPDIFLVLIVTKTLQGDEDSAIDPYLKANLKPKEKAKMEGDLKEICQRLGNYRQYFAFSCVQLFDDNNNFMMHENSNDNKTVQRNLVKLSPKGDIFSVINEFEKSKQKLKVIPGRFVVGLEMLPTYSGSALSHSDSSKTLKGSSNGPIPDIIDASLRAVSIPSSIFTTPPNKVLRELRDFRQPENRNYPNMSYMNELYLYIDTVNLNNYHGNTSCRNIAVEVKLMENDHNVQAEGLPAIYGRQSSSRNQLATKEVTTVVYHNKKPKYFEEIKIELPPIITSAHHLLVTFYHVKCQLKKLKKDEKPEITVGYSCIPLVQNGRVINDDTHSLPVGTVFPPKYRDPKIQDVIKWVDNKKPVFTFRTKLVSTIYTQDSNLNNFLNLNIQQNDDSVFEAVQQLGKSGLHSLIEYFPIVVKKLLLLISEGSPIVAEESLLSLVTVLDLVTQASSYGRYIVETYLQYVLDENHNDDAALPQPSAKPLYHELVRTWYKLIFQKHPRILDTYKYSWFLFGIITKVMILHLNQQGTLDAQTNLFNRFNREFVVDLKKLLLSFVPEIREKYHTSLYLFKGLNVSIALFFRDVLCILPKSDVFQMIYRYSRGLDDNNSVATLVDFKFLFLKIVADHEHYVPCNVPPSPKDAAAFNTQPADIKTALWQRHFIAGLLIDEVERTLSQMEPVIIRTAIEALCFILQKHNYDVRYKDDAVKQQRISTMYFPFLLTVIDNLDVLTRPTTQGGYAMSSNDRRTWLICFLYILKGLNVQYIKDWWKLETQKRQLGFFETLLLAIQSFQYNGKEGLLNEQPEEENTNASSLKDSAQSADDLSLSDSGSSFRKKDKEKKAKKERSSTSIPGRKSSVSSVPGRANNNDAKALLENRYMNISSPSLIETPENSSPESGVRKHTELRSWAQNAPRQQHSRTQSTNPTLSNMSIKGKLFIKSPKKEANLCREVGLVSINTILQLLSIRDFHSELVSKGSVFITKFWGVINTLLSKNQAVTFLESIFYVIAFLLADFKKPLFRYPNNGICEDLTFEIMRYCNSKLGSVRSHSSAILYLLIQDNFKEMKNFSRMKLQCTIALSKLVGTSDTGLSSNNSKSTTDFEELKGSLQKISSKSKEKDKGAKGSLGEQVEEMVERLFGVIRDSLKVKQMSWDPERTAELYYQISKGFVDSPDLRVTWLENLANFHNKNNHFEECAQTKLLTAYLVSGYLKLLNNFPADITSQEWGSVFPNLAIDHVLPPAQTLEALEGEICQSSLFSDEGYADLLKQAVGKLKLGALHESCVEVYQLLLPVFQKKRDYKRQAVCYQDLFVLCHTIVEENQKNQRLFSNYYRVAFFGDKFDDLDGKEFVYKEPSTVRLNEFTDRLKNQFGSRFGHDNIQLLANTKPVVKSELNPAIAYMQIISVDVCLTPEQLKTRQTLFDRNYNIDKFIFETPFTKSGKAHGDMAEQYKRKTILTVEAVFPYVRKRLLITKKEVIELTPIETAIELIQRKTLNLKAELSTATPNIKTLQMELQGSLLAQVNAGPLEVCRIFLGDNMTKYDKSHIESLMKTIDEFQVTLLKAIGVNSSLISPEQRILQQELELAYKNFSTEVKNYYSGASPKNDDDDQMNEDEDD